VLQGGLFVFVSRDRNRVKILYWDRDGYALWYKRLEAGTFRVEFNNGVEELRGVDLKLLLEGLELSRIRMRRDAEKGMYA
jgi:phage terminase Nu1 subunit (DNA packaging protein)